MMMTGQLTLDLPDGAPGLAAIPDVLGEIADERAIAYRFPFNDLPALSRSE
jgi:hypothetical protein